MSDTVDPELVDRFRRDLSRLWPDLDSTDAKLGLAVSGGPDSMAMLLLAHAAIPGRFDVATVDHGIRPEARDECALVERACAERGIPCAVLTVEVGEGNVQAMAREARYEALRDWAVERGLVALATAHHADDQAETLLMRLNRGSGIAGLAGVRSAFWNEHYLSMTLRPLLQFRRAELAGVVKSAGLAFASDPSNDDESFDRVRIRKALAEADWLDPLAIARSAGYLAEAEELIEGVVLNLWDSSVRTVGSELHVRLHPARVVNLRIIERGLRQFGGEARGGEIARLYQRLVKERKGNLAGIMVAMILTDDGPYAVFSPEPPRTTT